MKLFFLSTLMLFINPAFSQDDVKIEVSIGEKLPMAMRLPLDLGYEYLKVENTLIDPNDVATIIAPQGTKIEIAENSFVNAKGEKVESKIKISVREAIEPSDIILSSLHTITTDNQILQSKGMIEVKATSENQEVFLAKNKELKVTMTVDFEDGYQFYEGLEKNEGLKWTSPAPIERQDDELIERILLLRRGKCGYRSTIMYPKITHTMNAKTLESVTVHFVDGIETFYGESYIPKVGRKAGLSKEQAKVIEGWFERDYVRAQSLLPRGEHDKNSASLRMEIDIQKAKLLFGENASYMDPEVVNVFYMKNLGWANIDRLAKFQNAEKMKLMVDQNGHESIDSLQLTLVVPSANAFIPGSKKEDGKYAFTSDDSQSEILMPKDEKAFIVAIGTKAGQKFFDLKEIKLGENEIEYLNLRPHEAREIVQKVKQTF